MGSAPVPRMDVLEALVLSPVINEDVRAMMLARYHRLEAEYEDRGMHEMSSRIGAKILALRMEQAEIKRNRWNDPAVQEMARDTSRKLGELIIQLKG